MRGVCLTLLVVMAAVCFAVQTQAALMVAGASASVLPYTLYVDTWADLGSGSLMGINNNNVVAGRGQPGQPTGQAFVWSETTGTVYLPTLAGTSTGIAYEINDSGVVAGISAALNPSYNRAWRYDTKNTLPDLSDDVAVDVGLKIAGSTSSRCLAINNSGAVVGFASISGTSQGFYWDGQSASAQLIPPPPGADVAGWIKADINDFGMCVGYNQFPGAGDCAVYWRPGDSTATNIDPYIEAAFGQSCTTHARGVNNLGHIVGGYMPGISPINCPYLYLNSTTVVDLAQFMTWGNGGGVANAINDKGVVVGQGQLSDGTYHAFVWIPQVPNGTTGTMIDLNSLGFTLPPGYYFYEALDVNNLGSIVGTIYNGSIFRPFALIIPEPGTLASLAAGLLALLCYAWRKRR